MQVNNKVRDNHLIFKKIPDGLTYLILFVSSIVFTELFILLYVVQLRKSISTIRSDIIKDGLKAGEYVYKHILSLSSVVAQVVAYTLFICVIFAICFKVFKVEFQEFKLHLSKKIGMIILFSIGIYIVDVIISRFYSIIGVDGTSMNQLMIYGALASPVKVPTILLTIVFAPIVEEIIYRKFMFGALHQQFKLPIWVAGLLSAIIFSLLHVSSSLDQLIYFPQYFALALVLVGAYIYSGQNIYFSISVHVINNAISILLWAITTWI